MGAQQEPQLWGCPYISETTCTSFSCPNSQPTGYRIKRKRGRIRSAGPAAEVSLLVTFPQAIPQTDKGMLLPTQKVNAGLRDWQGKDNFQWDPAPASLPHKLGDPDGELYWSAHLGVPFSLQRNSLDAINLKCQALQTDTTAANLPNLKQKRKGAFWPVHQPPSCTWGHQKHKAMRLQYVPLPLPLLLFWFASPIGNRRWWQEVVAPFHTIWHFYIHLWEPNKFSGFPGHSDSHRSWKKTSQSIQKWAVNLLSRGAKGKRKIFFFLVKVFV